MQITTAGKVSRIKDYDDFYFGITSDETGRLFFVDRAEGRLFWTDVNGSEIPVAEPVPVSASSLTGVQAKYISSIDMDRDSYYVYYAITGNDGKVTLVRYDPVTGEGKISREIGNNSKETTGLYIAPRSKGTADAPLNLKVTPGSGGHTTAQASWNAPGSCAVYLNGSLVTETDADSYSFSGLKEGYNYVRVAGIGSDGSVGKYADAFFWAGPDILGPVTDVKTDRVYPDIARLQWTAPAVTVHGGYFSPGNVKYRVTRFASDGTDQIVANTHRDTCFTEKIAVPDVYYYTIQSLSTNFGETYTTEPMYYGVAFDVPYRCTFDDKDNVRLWATRQQPDNRYGWAWNDLLGCMYTTPLSIGNDDWLISPPVKMKKGKEYVIYTKVTTGSGPANARNLEIGTGLNADTVAMTPLRTVVVDNFTASGPMEFRTVFIPSEDGEYSVYLRDLNPPVNANLSLYGFAVLENNLGHISGTVTDGITGRTLENVEVSVKGTTLKTMTDAEGHYDLKFIEGDGNYTLTASLFGYLPYTSASIAAPDGRTTSFDFSMQPVPEITVRGTVTDTGGKPLSGVRVLLTNYGDMREAFTDADGKYTVRAMQAGTYRIELYKRWHSAVIADFSAAADTTVAFRLARKNLVPNKPIFDNAKDGVKLTWDSPYDLLRRDNGEAISQNGNREGNANSLYGTVWRLPATVKAVSWQTTRYLGPHNKINVWILDLTPDGLPSTKVLYKATGIDSEDARWIRHVLETPVECPNGFYMAVSQDKGMVSIATADGKDPEWPFVPGVQYRAFDFTSGTWYCVDGKYINNNYMLRAECSALGDDTGDCLYTLWRLAEGEEDNRAAWILLEKDFASRKYTDIPETGRYRYALSAAYPDGELSDPVLSEVVDTRFGGISLNNIEGFNPAPNPVENILHLGTVCDKVAVYDLSGRILVTGKCTGELDLSGIPAGCYILDALKENNKKTVKIIKK